MGKELTKGFGIEKWHGESDVLGRWMCQLCSRWHKEEAGLEAIEHWGSITPIQVEGDKGPAGKVAMDGK